MHVVERLTMGPSDVIAPVDVTSSWRYCVIAPVGITRDWEKILIVIFTHQIITSILALPAFGCTSFIK
jgi:hypothetical protein